QLLLTNEATQHDENTQNVETTRYDGNQVTLTEPDVQITKGVVSVDSGTSGTFSPTEVGPATFKAASNTSAAPFTGTINSVGLAATPIDSNLSGVDAGDVVRFAN